MTPAPTPRSHRLLALLSLIVVALAWHLPGIGRPFGPIDVNPGEYFGTYVRNFERHGFWRLRGVPLIPQVTTYPREATPHLSHPPGFTWVSQLFGTDEASFRWPTIITVILATLCLFELLLPRFGLWPALAAALVFLGLPGNAVLCQGSFEMPVLGAGMALLLATERVLAGRARWRIVQALATFYGSWSDWGLAYFCVGLLLFCLPKGRAGLAALVVPAISGVIALLLLWLWHKVAFAPEVFGENPPTADAGELVRTHVLHRVPLAEFFAGSWHQLSVCLTAAAPLVAAAGLVTLLAADWSLALALVLAGVIYPTVFTRHAVTHFHVWCNLAPLVAAAIAALAASIGRVPRLHLVLPVALPVLIGWTWHCSYELRRANDTSYFRDLGALLTTETQRDNRPGLPNLVLTNNPQNMGYYSPVPAVVVTPIWDPAQLEALHRVHRIRYLWTKTSGMSWGMPTTSPELEKYLAGFPFRRIGALETELHYAGTSEPYRIEEARLYLLDP